MFIGEKAGASIGAIVGFILIGVVVAFVAFFGYRLAILLVERMTFLQIIM